MRNIMMRNHNEHKENFDVNKNIKTIINKDRYIRYI